MLVINSRQNLPGIEYPAISQLEATANAGYQSERLLFSLNYAR
jgi:hypothetical protein